MTCKRIAAAFCAVMICISLGLAAIAADSRGSIEVSAAEGASVNLPYNEAAAGNTVSFSIKTDEAYVLRGLELLDDLNQPIHFSVVGEFVYSFVMPEGNVKLIVRADDYSDVTRAECIMRIWELEGKPVVNYLMRYTDVDADAEYAEAVRWAASEKIILENESRHFYPDSLLTREQLAAVLSRYASLLDERDADKNTAEDAVVSEADIAVEDNDISVDTDIVVDTDIAAEADDMLDESEAEFVLDVIDREFISDWAYEPVCWAVKCGIMSKTNGPISYFKPHEQLKKYEFDYIIDSFIELFEDAPDDEISGEDAE